MLKRLKHQPSKIHGVFIEKRLDKQPLFLYLFSRYVVCISAQDGLLDMCVWGGKGLFAPSTRELHLKIKHGMKRQVDFYGSIE